jgi:hypothetical protein
MKKLNSKVENISQTLFIDIETSALSSNYKELSPPDQKYWDIKTNQLKRPNDIDFGCSQELFYQKRAGIYAEFSRIVCISVGYIDVITKHKALIITKSFFHLNESKILNEFAEFLQDKTTNNDIAYLCGHNLKEFDIPFLCRRMIVNNIILPDMIMISGKKPWQIPFIIDTLELWKFGDYKNYISLDLLCSILKVPSSKEEMSGSDVHDYFWVKKQYSKICEYCELDVYSTALVYLRLRQIFQKLDLEHKSKTDFENIQN